MPADKNHYSLIVAALMSTSGCAGTKHNLPPLPTSTHVKCLGINGCKAQADCAMKDDAGRDINVCGGQNGCKAQGWLDLTDDGCAAAGGTAMPGSERVVSGCSTDEPVRLAADVARTEYLLDDGIALSGYDPVSYFPEGGGVATEGKADIAHTHEGVTYYFANPKNLERFIANPKNFEPAYGGWCAYGLAKAGKKVTIDPEAWRIENGRLLLFYRNLLIDTRDSWDELGQGHNTPTDNTATTSSATDSSATKVLRFQADSAWFNLAGECYTET